MAETAKMVHLAEERRECLDGQVESGTNTGLPGIKTIQ